MKEQNRIANVVNSKFYPLLLFFVSFVFVTLFSRSTSFLYVFEGADPSIFKQMGRAILKGKILYIDYFDNKGCLLYFIHALGLGLGGNTALLLMQACSLTVTLLIWDKMLALYRNTRQRWLSLIVALFLLFCFYGAGDQTQEWCLPFISYPLLVFMRAYKSKTEIRHKQIFVIGLCFGFITFIQVNNACAFLGFIVWMWLQYLLKKDFKKLFVSILCFAGGWLVVALPCVLYFLLKAGWHGVYEMVYASFLSNFEYMGVQHYTKWFHWLPYTLFLLGFSLLNILNLRKQKDLLIPFLISTLLFVGTFGKLCNTFYLMALLPLCIVGMTTFSFETLRKVKLSLVVVTTAFVAFLGSISVFHVVNDLILHKEKEIAIYDCFHRCIVEIPELERDSIFNYNLFWHGYGMMEHEKLLQCNRVSIAYDLPTLIKEEVGRPLIPPKWIMVSPDLKIYKTDASFILDNYELVSEFQYDRLYFRKPKIGNRFRVFFYRRKA